MFDSEEREPWRAQAEAACYARNLVKLSPYIQKSGAIEGRGICGIDRPLKVSALEDGTVGLGSRALVLSCPMTAALESWVRETVMPAAYAHYGSPVVGIDSFGTYSCRSRNNIAGARLSEHAFANAFDFAGVRLANGYEVTVKAGWQGSAADRAFLRDITAGACGPFTTVLGPGSDRLHEDHLHLDLAHHNNKGTYRYCKPHPAPSGLPGGGAVMASAAKSPMMAGAASYPAPSYRLPPISPPVFPSASSPISPAPSLPTFDQPLPPAPVEGTSLPAAVRAPAEPPASCPAGYICTPARGNGAALQATPAPPIGWSVGAQPIGGYAPGEITGSVPGYSDD